MQGDIWKDDLACLGLHYYSSFQKCLNISMYGFGVGYYPRGGFVHIDSGNFRAW